MVFMRLNSHEKYNKSALHGLSSRERRLLDAFEAAEKVKVAAVDVEELLGVDRSVASRILSRLQSKGWLFRLKRGLYSVVPLGAPSPEASLENSWAIAMALFEPCMISGWTAAEHWDLTEQIFNSTAVLTTTPQRSRTRTVAGLKFVCRVVAPSRFFGAVDVWSGGVSVKMADPHRTVVDILDSPSFGGGARHSLDVVRAYWLGPHANADQVLRCAKQLRKGAVLKRLGFTAELWGNPSDAWNAECREGMTTGISQLDPKGSKKGRIVSRWGLRVNVPVPPE
jgi:predicted transcriptional regulator of viral defense system